jgi:hypothetical protein
MIASYLYELFQVDAVGGDQAQHAGEDRGCPAAIRADSRRGNDTNVLQSIQIKSNNFILSTSYTEHTNKNKVLLTNYNY